MATELKAPWIKNLGGVPASLTYRQCSMYEILLRKSMIVQER